MAIARSKLVDETKSGVYHLVNRCVRRTFLLGNESNHRRNWLQEALRAKTAIFAIDVLAYAIMDNHFHLIVKTHPKRAARWGDLEVAQRWTTLCPPKNLKGQVVKLKPEELHELIAKPGWVKERRKRLASMSWLMKLIKEKLARQANREDKCHGHFWEGRFVSVPLLDQAAVLAGMVYVDLNPIRAKMADTPEASEYTSVQERIMLNAGGGGRLPRKLRRAGLQQDDHKDDRKLTQLRGEVLRKKAQQVIKPWVVAIKECAPGAEVECSLTLADYLQLVDLTARRVRKDKRGAMDGTLEPILERLGLDADKWVEAMTRGGKFRGRAVGSPEARARHLADRAAVDSPSSDPPPRWIADKTPVYLVNSP